MKVLALARPIFIGLVSEALDVGRWGKAHRPVTSRKASNPDTL
jgi:hypothetical protein